MRPAILLTCDHADRPSLSSEGQVRQQAELKTTYIRAVEKAGGVPLVLPSCPNLDVIIAALSVADGLLLPGGQDMGPYTYDQVSHPATKCASPLRDEAEIATVREALRRNVPILGICRGIQVINVALGGTLIQDLPAGTKPDHRRDDHRVDIENGTRLAGIWPAGKIVVNSRHHQAIDTLACGLRLVARAPDGVIEAVESADGSDLLALQCHPEDLVDKAEFRAVFRWLVDRAAKNKNPQQSKREPWNDRQAK